MLITNNPLLSDLVGTSAPSLIYSVYDPVADWNRAEFLGAQRGSICIQIADAGLDCFAPEIIAIWYKRKQNDNISDWAMMFALPAIGTAVPTNSNDDLCALPVGSVYVQTAGINCVDQLWLKVRQECGAGSCNDWVPLLLTLARAGDEVGFDADTNTLTLPIEGNLTSEGDGEYQWTPDDGSLAYSFYIPSLVDNADGTFTYDPRDGSSVITINTNSDLVIPADISAVNRPWVTIGQANATNATNVNVTDHIFHTGIIVRGATSVGTLGSVGAELVGNNALGAGNHDMTSAANSTIASGSSNEIKSTSRSFVGGGQDNVVTGVGAPTTNVNMAILAGVSNTITDAPDSIIGGGGSNSINGPSSAFLGGGTSNSITSGGGQSVLVGGQSNLVSGLNAAVLAGRFNEAVGLVSTALGLKSQVSHNYSLLINTLPGGDPNTDTDPFNSAGDSEFAVRCNNIRFFTNLAQSAGMTMAAGASAWVAVSDENAKKDIWPATDDALSGYRTLLPVSYYMGERIGAGITAQNWYNAFPFIMRKYVGGYLGVNQAERDGIQDMAIKQLLGIVDDLVERVAILERKLALAEGD